VQAALGTAGVWHLRHGPRASGTAFLLLYHMLGHRAGGLPGTGIVRGGIGSLAQALVAVAEDAGATVRTGVEVREICLENGQVSGVRLATGEIIMAPVVLSTANPNHTFRDLVSPAELPPTFNRRVGNIKYRGAVAKVNLALAGLPAFSAAGGADQELLAGRIQIAPTLNYVERAYDAAKYGRYAEELVLEATIPTLHEPSLAPPGQHTMSVQVQYVPYHLRESTWPVERERLGDTVVDTLARYAPGIRELVHFRQVLTPVDLEEKYRLVQGNVYHGEMTLDQLLFMRPVPGWGQYRTPISGLYLGGSGAHPGGGITGEPGRLAAQAILRDRDEA
jgi:phytoene dehydrogenase-like protein